MPNSEMKFIQSKSIAFWIGALFLFGYWYFGFDGITFSDDVFYLLAGKTFWEGTMEFNAYHFSTRWGAYVPSGLISFFFGFDPHRISLISLVSYLGSLALLLRILPKNKNPWILLIWFSTQIYLLHFLTKVYPDSILVFWTVLVPFSAVFREKKPFWAALGVISGLYFGFLTKETIVFLAPLPVLLFVFDWKKGIRNLHFYFALVGLGLAFGAAYLGYFWIEFGHPLYRLESIQDGHYISEFTYADKSGWVMLKRLTILPLVTFVERSYWLWIVFAVPGLVKTWRKPSSPGIEFCLAFLSLVSLFWFMSTNFRFYNPLYLNPRHLILLVPVLAFLITLDWEEWSKNIQMKRIMSAMIVLGVVISLLQQDWKMAGYQSLAIVLIYAFQGQRLTWAIGIYLLIPGLLAIRYQKNLKEYDQLIKTLTEEVKNPADQSLILTNNFLDFSKEVLFYEDKTAQKLLFPIEKLDSLRTLQPAEIRVILYDYYRHAYPKEQDDLDILEPWLLENYTLNFEETESQVWIRNYSRK